MFSMRRRFSIVLTVAIALAGLAASDEPEPAPVGQEEPASPSVDPDKASNDK